MNFRKNRQDGSPSPSSSDPNQSRSNSGPAIELRDLPPGEKPQRRNFPGPRGAQAALRVAIDRTAHAELIAHAKESLNAEICGVLAGAVCQDDEGLFVQVQAVIRGTSATQGSTRVTFTQATWTAIHQTLEQKYPDLKIVGWYHSHPGFGVEFSEMDLFIQRNFFSSPTQFALVTDPVNGAVAICINTPAGIEYLPRFWVDGREQECKVPPGVGASAPAVEDSSGRVRELEERVGQLTLAVDDLRNSLHRFLLFAGFVFGLGVIAVAGYTIYLQLKERTEPPRNIGFAHVPVRIGDHNALLGVSIVSWDLPPELNAILHEAAAQLREEIENEAAKGGLSVLPTNSVLPPANP